MSSGMINFYNTIPATNNNPSNDQPLMLEDNQAISQIWSVDHVGFNVNNSGQHQKVTFNSSLAPGSKFPALTTAADGFGIFQLFYNNNGTNAQSSDNYVANQPGSTFAFGGIILKWAYVVNPTSNTDINFVTPFPHACWTVVATPVKSGAITSLTGFTIKGSPTVNNFRILFSGTTLDAVTYIAIGN